MMKYFALVLVGLMSACGVFEGPEGPQGPAGPVRIEYFYTEIDYKDASCSGLGVEHFDGLTSILWGEEEIIVDIEDFGAFKTVVVGDDASETKLVFDQHEDTISTPIGNAGCKVSRTTLIDGDLLVSGKNISGNIYMSVDYIHYNCDWQVEAYYVDCNESFTLSGSRIVLAEEGVAE